MTAEKVYIGMSTAEDASQFADALGLRGLSGGDAKAQAQALVKDIERRGGLGGRKIEIVWHDYNTAQLVSDPATANQAACATWTEDNKVFAVLGLYDPTLVECLHKSDTPLINAGASWDLQAVFVYSHVYKRYPNYFLLGGMLGERFDRMSIGRLVARNFFQKWDTRAGQPGAQPMKLGLMMPDTANGRLSVANIKRELARVGITPASENLYSPEGLGIQGQQSSVLKFRTDGVTHVIGAALPFMNTAESQAYYPRYFIDVGMYLIAQNAPPSQLRGAMAESLQPTSDVPSDQDPGDTSPAATYCKKIMKDANLENPERIAQWSQQVVCDQLLFLKDAVDRSGELTTSGLRRGLEALGSRPSALTWTSYLGPGEHASGRSMRDLEYRPDCSCFGYVDGKTYSDAP